MKKIKRYILTGTPGSGKTAIIRQLELSGYNVIEEAATDVIQLEQACGNPTPWSTPDFIEKVARLQIQRRETCAELGGEIQFYDRSPLCTLALAQYLQYPVPSILLNEIKLIKREPIYQIKIFFLENLGYCEPTAIRKISFEEALCFEKIHQAVYHAHGFDVVHIAKKSVPDRAQVILAAVANE